MLTIFTTPKPFEGHSAIIQRNALKSWTLLHPDVEVILFGDENGAAEVAQELKIRHEAQVERSLSGAKFLDYLFRRAQEIASHNILCYVNCDIILLADYWSALQRVAFLHAQFLMVGRRWDTDITKPLDFSLPHWEESVRNFAREKGVEQPPVSVDYFAFRRGLYPEVPRLVVGRIWWDHWLVWKARQNGADIVDVSKAVTAIHQNHDYGYHPAGYHGVTKDAESNHNWDLAGGLWHLYTIDDATHILSANGERQNWKRLWAPYRRYFMPAWFTFLDWTRPVRKVLGLRQRNLRALTARWRER